MYRRRQWGQVFTLDMADVSPVRVELATRLICDLLLEPLDLAAQVRDNVGVLSDVVRHIYQVLLHLVCIMRDRK